MKIIKDVPAAPEPPRLPERHDCGKELRRLERDQDLWRRYGLQVQCFCGCRYEMRPMGWLKDFFGVGFNNEKSRFPSRHYWHYLGWSEPQ